MNIDWFVDSSDEGSSCGPSGSAVNNHHEKLIMIMKECMTCTVVNYSIS